MYSPIVMEHFIHPRNVGTLENPDGVGQVGSPGEGEFVRVQISIDGCLVKAARFQTFGCGPAIAACSLLTEWATNKMVAEVANISPEELSELLGGLPPDKLFCAELAVSALKKALENCA